MDGFAAQIETWLTHIHALAAGIGPRGSTTEGERRAAGYAAGVMRGLGLSPQVEAFISATSGYQLHFLVAISMLIAFGVYPMYGRISAAAAALIAFTGIGSEVLDLLFRDNPLRRLITMAPSQNVIGILPPAGERRQDLVLIGHLDTNRCALVFSSTGWVNFWRIITPVMFFSFCAQVVLYVIGAVTQWPWAWPATIVSAALALTLAFFCAEGELAPYTPGANDNATAAGLVLTLAEHLQAQPLGHTQVWLVNTGCEEVKHYGAIDFFQRHSAEMVHPRVIVFEMLGRDGPAWLEREVIIPPFAYKADPGMIALLEKLVAEDPGLTGHPTLVMGGHTEMADPLRFGIPAVTLIGVGPDGTPLRYKGPRLYWHQREDTADKIDPAVLRRAYALTWAFVHALDAQAAGKTISSTGETLT
jgi:hypothetical protein